MTKTFRKQNLPVEQARRYLEPGPIVLLSSAWNGQRNIMTLGWHTVMEFSPSLVGCVISSANHSFALVRNSRACVLNVPTVALTDEVVGIGTTSGADIDKFAHFGLSADAAACVDAPLIRECCAHFECRLFDDRLIDDYNFFIWEVVRAWAAVAPKYPETLHYTGEGVFRVAGKVVSRRRAGLL